jgi:hypothetical protein
MAAKPPQSRVQGSSLLVELRRRSISRVGFGRRHAAPGQPLEGVWAGRSCFLHSCRRRFETQAISCHGSGPEAFDAGRPIQAASFAVWVGEHGPVLLGRISKMGSGVSISAGARG